MTIIDDDYPGVFTFAEHDVSVLESKGFVTLTVERPEIRYAMTSHLPEYNGGDLSAAQREQIVTSWQPTYAASTRAVWDEAVDPLMFTGVTSYDLRDPSVTSYAEKLRRDGPAEAVGDASIFVSHALDNSPPAP